MAKKRAKLFGFLFCVALICLFGVARIAHAEEKKEPEVTIQTGAYGEIVNVESGKRLNVKGNSSAQEAAVTIYQQDGTTGQKWQFLSFPNGYSLIPECGASTGRVLNIYGYSAQAGSRICLWNSTQSNTQCWTVEAFEDGSFILRSKSNPDFCLAESGTGNGSAITLKAYTATDKSIRWTSSLVTVTKEEEPEEPKVIKLSTENVRTYKGIPIKLVLENADAAKVTWKTSSSSKGTVSKDGIVTAKKKNCTFTVYATYKGVKYSVKVKVEKNDPKYKTYSAKTYYAKKSGVPVYVDPHSSATVVKRLCYGETVKLVGQISNVANNTWYITDEGYYVYSGNCSSKKLYSEIAGTVLFAQHHDTTVYSAPDVTSDGVDTMQRHEYLTAIGELTDKSGAKWYVLKGPENTFRYIRGEDFATTTYLSDVEGCVLHRSEVEKKGLCTFCATKVMISRRAEHDGLGAEAVTWEMIRAQKDPLYSGLVYAQTYPINGGTASYRTEWINDGGVSNKDIVIYRNIHDVATLIALCNEHPEGIVIYDSLESDNGVNHAVCVSHYVILEDGTYQFYVYDTNTNGGNMVPLEVADIYIDNGSNLQTLLNNLRWIMYIP